MKIKYLQVFIYLVFVVLFFIMFNSILRYASFKLDVGFLQLKQEYVHDKLWLSVFYIHVFTTFFLLMSGFTQFVPLIRKEYKQLHQRVGYIYIIGILVVNVPVGFVMALYANGGISSKVAFLLLDFLWFWFTFRAWLALKNGDIQQHQLMMIRSFALTCSAITLRLWNELFSTSIFYIEPNLRYMINAWIGFVPNLVFVEWYIKNKLLNKLS